MRTYVNKVIPGSNHISRRMLPCGPMVPGERRSGRISNEKNETRQTLTIGTSIDAMFTSTTRSLLGAGKRLRVCCIAAYLSFVR
jgi:hypothetical protein